ncbi:MAG: tetratricopeptide repeat protein [Candidatus Aminicenantes bacterium]|nr:tetratricopeptide repeat protein [Candidatus Aminicenantes bacterium]
MKKNITSLTLLILIVLLMVGFTACDKLKMSNLRANYYLRQGNGFYQEEKYKKAIEAYEKALSFNQDLKLVYFHLATSYSSLYKPAKETEANKMYGEKALEYLKKAREFEPDNIQIVHVLGDLYEKMEKIDEAEECYLNIMETSGKNPKVYYVLANFYQTHNQVKKAENMYKQRLDMEPENPEGYHYIAGFYQNQNDWYRSVESYELMISALIDPAAVKVQREIQGYNESLDKIKSKKEYMANVKKNAAIPADQRNEIVAKITKELEEIGSEAEIAKKIEEKKKEVAQLKKQADIKVMSLPEAKKDAVAEAYYMLGLVLWNQSHQTSPEYMGPQERMQVIAKGIEASQKAVELKKNYYEPWSIVALLHLQKIKANPLKEAEYRALWQAAYDKAISIRDRNMRKEKLQKELEEMGEKAAKPDQGGK